MKRQRRRLIVCLASASVGVPTLAASPARRLVQVLGTTDRAQVQPLIDDFGRLHPGLELRYLDRGSVEANAEFLADANSAQPRTDAVWSSAMDLQIKLVNDGWAARHDSPHAASLPRWALWKNEAFATTFEPVGIAFNRAAWQGQTLPRNRQALAALLLAEPARFMQRVASYDIERAGLGYLLATHDAAVSPQTWDLVRALGACKASLHANTQGMLDELRSGRALLAYNVLGPYAESLARQQGELELVYPDDYTLVASRVAFMGRRAPNPDGARQWLDHLLSARGQQVLAAECGLYALHAAVTSQGSASALGQRLGAAARPIKLGPGLMARLDRTQRAAFVDRWRHAFADAGRKP